MATCDYNPVNTNQEIDCEKERISWRPLLRQLHVCTGAWSLYMILGLCFGAPTVFIHQIRKEANSTDAISEEMASWFGSVHGYSALPWVFIVPVFIQIFGRKWPFHIVSINVLVAYIVFYCSTSPMHLLISEIMQGLLLGSNMTLLVTMITEYTSPQYRGLFLSIHSSMFHIGVWVANATGIFTNWRNIGIVAFILCAYTATAVNWPESPYWLAMKGRYHDCSTAHRWLKGTNENSEKELDDLIKSQKEFIKFSGNQNRSFKDSISYIRKTMVTKSFYQPLLLSILMIALYHFSGKLVCSMYSIQILNKMTNSESKAYVDVLILEGVTILGMQVGCILIKKYKRRMVLFVTSTLGISLLFTMSLYFYLITLGTIYENEYVSICLLTLFSISISCGPMIITIPIFGELIPIRYRTSCLTITILFAESLMATILKISPYIFTSFGMHGAFLFYGISSSCITFILYKYLPETKDKTLQEIENYFKP